MSGNSSLVTYADAAQALHTTVQTLYQLRRKDKRPFPEKGKVDLEWFARNRIAYDNALRDARRFWFDLQQHGWTMERVATELRKRYGLSRTTTRTMLKEGIWLRVKRRQYYYTVPKSIQYLLRMKDEIHLD